MSMPEQPRDSRRYATLAKSVLTLAFVTAGVAYVSTRFGEFQSLAWPSATAIAVVAFGFIASVLFRSLFNFFAARQLGSALTLRESFMLSAVVTASNAILPANPGATFRAVYMKKVHGFAYGYFASATAVSFLVTTLIISLVGMGLLLLISRELGYFRLDLFIALPLISIVTGAGLFLRGSTHAGQGNSIWTSFKSGYFDLVGESRLVYLSILVVSANLVVAGLVWVVALREYAPDITALEGFLFAASQIVSGLINLTPGAAGFQEVVGIYVGQSFAITAVELFAILIWVRVVRVLTAIILSIPCAIALQLRTH